MSQNETPWLKEYKVFGIPKSLEPYPDKPVFEILYRAAKKYKRRGLIQFNYQMNYPDVRDHVDRLATALYAMGLTKGDRVATLLPTSIQFIIADYAISRAGLVQISMSHLEPVKNLAHKFEQGTPKALICLDENLDITRELLQVAKTPHIILTSLADYSTNPPDHHEAPDIDGAVWITDIIENTPPNPPELEFDVDKDLEMLLFTGGTTGLPKGCMLTHRNIYANCLQASNSFGQAHKLIQGAVSVLLGLPFFHSYGHIMMHTMTQNGYTQILLPDARDTKAMVEMIKTYYPALQFGVPTQFMKLAKEELNGIGILAISGSAPLSQKTQKEFEEKSRGGIMEGYGLSEMSPVTHLNPSLLLRLFGGRVPLRINNMFLALPGVAWTINWLLRLLGPKRFGWAWTRSVAYLLKATAKDGTAKKDREKRGTTGIPYPDTEIKLIDVNTGERLSMQEMLSGKRGEMCLKGPQRMLGYWPEPGSGLDEEGYVRTSDVVEIDERGYFSIVDRTKDMIIVSGYKVYSRELDDILINHPAVEMAATVGVPDPEREGSERVAVYIQPRAEFMEKLTTDEMLDYLRDRVAKYAVPKFIRIIEKLPLTEVQKLDKKALREIAAKDFGGTKAAAS